jgi:hypothetical protein
MKEIVCGIVCFVSIVSVRSFFFVSFYAFHICGIALVVEHECFSVRWIIKEPNGKKEEQ